MARCLIIACGCRGAALAREVRTNGHAVRGTTRDAARLSALEARGIEPHLGDPDRVATLAPALEHVTVACILLGSARGTDEELADLHGSRLEMLLTRMLDTTVRGIVYEAAGSMDHAALAVGARIVRDACEASLIPYVLLEADPAEHDRWLAAATGGVQTLL
ncbi:MAG: hypothetical protein ACR2JH_08990 [Solirubrobacteraceae bacterium]